MSYFILLSIPAKTAIIATIVIIAPLILYVWIKSALEKNKKYPDNLPMKNVCELQPGDIIAIIGFTESGKIAAKNFNNDTELFIPVDISLYTEKPIKQNDVYVVKKIKNKIKLEHSIIHEHFTDEK